MICIHRKATVSPQRQLLVPSLEEVNESVANVLNVVEPTYEGIPLSLLRRMGKAVRMGVGTALPLLRSWSSPVNGIVIGTANGGMEDCIKFLNQVIEFEEGTLTPTNFVQSTPNAVASQLSLLSKNMGYNITHVNRGLAFENALLDVDMLLKENPHHTYLLGGVEEVSSYNYNIDHLADWFKKTTVSNKELFDSDTDGTLSGEGTAMFMVNATPAGALALVEGFCMIHTDRIEEAMTELDVFLAKHLTEGESIDLLLSGESGDRRSRPFFEACEARMKDALVVRYKHLIGDFGSASSLALAIGVEILHSGAVPGHMKKNDRPSSFSRLLICNQYKKHQHSFILVRKP